MSNADLEDLPPGLVDELVARLEPQLQPTSPREGVEMYLDDRSSELERSTLRGYRSSLRFFVDFCESNGIDDLNDLTGRDLRDYRKWRREQSSDAVETLARKTVKDEQCLVRNFVEYLETVEAVKPGLHEKVVVPDLSPADETRDGFLEKDRVRAILDHLETYEYATIEHVTWVILTVTGGRISAAHSLDVDDCKLDTAEPYLELRHRPDRGTRLKGKYDGERNLSIAPAIARIIQAYLDDQRPQSTDDYDREPLLASTSGRISKSSIRRYVYKWSRPCQVRGECPHGETIDECHAARNADTASKCPSSHPPHDIRRGYITEELDAGVPIEVISDRCDVSPEVIEKHYDKRTEEQKRSLRREILEEVHGSPSGGYYGANGGHGGNTNV